MPVEKDVRQERLPASQPDPAIASADFSLLAERHAIGIESVNVYTGTPRRLRVTDAGERESGTDRGERREWCRERAREYLLSLGEVLAPQASAPIELAPEPCVHVTSTGIAVPRFYQHCAGVPVFESCRAVRFDPDGRMIEVRGDNAPLTRCETRPQLSAREAAGQAAAYLGRELGLRVTAALPTAQATFGGPRQATVLRKRPFDDGITAQLIAFYYPPELVLTWSVVLDLTDPPLVDSWEVLVAAREAPGGVAPGDILLCHSLVDHSARARVYEHNPGESGPTQVVFPGSWGVGAKLAGQHGVSYRGDNPNELSGRVVGADTLFEFTTPQDDRDQRINAFWWCHRLHDFFSELGFGVAEGNFSNDGDPDDRLEIRVFGSFAGDALLKFRADGRSPELWLGRVGSGAAARHTALDADIVIHEYVHGVVNRLLQMQSTNKALTLPQSRALGEGYSDYFALTLQNDRRDPSAPNWTYGAWVNAADLPREHAYDDDHPFTYGTARGLTGPHRFHHAGEIWCLALVRFNAALGALLADRRAGNKLGWQLVIDSVKLLSGTGAFPSSPHFLHARNALLEALMAYVRQEGLPEDAYETAFWKVFAGVGMGRQARTDDADFAGIHEDFTP